MAKYAENLVSAQSVLISAATGIGTMAVANLLRLMYGLPPRWVALAISFLLGLAVLTKVRRSQTQQILCYLCSSSIIFLVAVASNRAGMALAGLAGPAPIHGGPIRAAAAPDARNGVLQHLDMADRTRSSGNSRKRPRLVGGTGGSESGQPASGPPPASAHTTQQASQPPQRPLPMRFEAERPAPDAARGQSAPASGHGPRFFRRW